VSEGDEAPGETSLEQSIFTVSLMVSAWEFNRAEQLGFAAPETAWCTFATPSSTSWAGTSFTTPSSKS
jgi:hypothetical protein